MKYYCKYITFDTIAILCSILWACRQPDIGMTRMLSASRMDLADRLKVLHVNSEYGKASGYPLTSTIGVSSEHQFDERASNAAVDGRPMLSTYIPPYRVPNSGPRRGKNDWRILVGVSGLERFELNVIDPNVELKVGDKVYLGGFPLVYRDYSAKEFLRMKPLVIEGTLVELDSKDKDWEGLVLVRVPPAEYGGFSGGPAAVIDDEGTIRVWGTIVRQGYRSLGWFQRDYVLCVAPLPRDFMDMPLMKK